MKILNVIAEALKGKQAPNSAKLAELLARAEAETAAAKVRLADLEGQRQDKALAGESERLAYRADLAAARDDVADGEAAIMALRDKHSAAVEAEAEDGRRNVHRAAKAKSDELPMLIDEYARLTQQVRDVLAKIAEIDAVIRAANKNLPAGALDIAHSGRLRSVPAQTKEIIGETVVDLWCLTGSLEPVSELLQDKIMVQADGSGYHHPPSARHPLLYEKRRFTRREVRAATLGVHAVDFNKIVLPEAYTPRPSNERPVVVEFIPIKTAA